jgi:NDP-sugar pyrophosphorylase family protein
MVTLFDGAILAAGSGQRLRPAVGPIPKPMVALGGLPLLLRQAEALKAAGARSIVAVVNSESARILAERRIELPTHLTLCVRDTANSMESLFALGEQLASDYFLLATVDSVVAQSELTRFAASAAAVTERAGADRCEGALALVRWRGDRRPLFATLDADGIVTALGAGESPLVTAGFYFLSRRIFDFVASARAAGLDALRRFLAMLLAEQVRLAGIEIDGAIDVDEGTDLAAARALVAAEAKG